MELRKYSFRTKDRFVKQGEAQLAAMIFPAKSKRFAGHLQIPGMNELIEISFRSCVSLARN